MLPSILAPIKISADFSHIKVETIASCTDVDAVIIPWFLRRINFGKKPLSTINSNTLFFIYSLSEIPGVAYGTTQDLIPFLTT